MSVSIGGKVDRVGLLIVCTQYALKDQKRTKGLRRDAAAWRIEMEQRLPDRHRVLSLGPGDDVRAKVEETLKLVAQDAAKCMADHPGDADTPPADPDVLVVVVGLGTQVEQAVFGAIPVEQADGGFTLSKVKAPGTVKVPALAVGSKGAALVLGPRWVCGSLAEMMDEALSLHGSRRAATVVLDCAFSREAPAWAGPKATTRSLSNAPKADVPCSFGPHDTVIGGGTSEDERPMAPVPNKLGLVPPTLTQVLLGYDCLGVELDSGTSGFRVCDVVFASGPNKTLVIIGGSNVTENGVVWSAGTEYWQGGYPAGAFDLVPLANGALPPSTAGFAAMPNKTFSTVKNSARGTSAQRVERSSGPVVSWVKSTGTVWHTPIAPTGLVGGRIAFTTADPLKFKLDSSTDNSTKHYPLV